MSQPLDEHEIAARLQSSQPAVTTPPRRWIRPITQTAEDLIELSLNEDGRYMFGIQPLDLMVRGLRPGDLCIITGRSHSAKTYLMLQSLVANPQARVLWATPDEMAEAVLLKLVTMVERIDPVHLEKQLGAKDPDTMNMLRHFAAERFPNLVVVDDTVDIDQLEMAHSEATDHWGQPCDLLVFDYLELMPSDREGYTAIMAAAQAFKSLAKKHRMPVCVVHQASRGGSKRGQSGGIEAMRGGGEAEATFVIECYRKTDDQSLSEFERSQQASTVTVNVAKSKRLGGHKGQLDLFIHPTYGFIREQQVGDVGTPREYEGRNNPGTVEIRQASQGTAIAQARERLERSNAPQVGPSGVQFEADSF